MNEFQSNDIDRREYLTFLLADEEYGVDILKVQEIRGYEKTTRIPGAPTFIKGVINLRGAIVPIVDMRIKLALEAVEYNEFTVVIILNLNGRMVGVVVDGVQDVLALSPAQIQSTPDMDSAIDQRFILGLATLEDRMLILLEIDGLMTSRDMQLIDGMVGA